MATASGGLLSHPEIDVLKNPFEEENTDEEIEIEEIFPEHADIEARFQRSLYYGYKPLDSDRLSFPLTELCVEHFNYGSTEFGAKLNRLDMNRAAQVSRETCSSPTSLVLALMYLERLRGRNPAYLHAVSSADLFLVSLLVASKFLHDDGEEDEVFNEEWATSGGMEKKDLNKLEIEFLTAIDWKIYVSPEDFEKAACKLESVVAGREIERRGGWTTYTDLLVLSRKICLKLYWDLMAKYTIKVTAVCVAAYATCFVTMIATCHLLNRANLGPSAVSTSLNTLYSAASRVRLRPETAAAGSKQPAAIRKNPVPDVLSNDTAIDLGEDDDVDVVVAIEDYLTAKKFGSSALILESADEDNTTFDVDWTTTGNDSGHSAAGWLDYTLGRLRTGDLFVHHGTTNLPPDEGGGGLLTRLARSFSSWPRYDPADHPKHHPHPVHSAAGLLCYNNAMSIYNLMRASNPVLSRVGVA